MPPKPPPTIAGDDHEEESPLLTRQEDSSSEDSSHLEIIFPTGTTKSSLDETRTTYNDTPESPPPPGPINNTTPDDIKKYKRKRIVLISLLVLFMVLLEFGMTFISTPLYQIQEDIICRQQFLPLPEKNPTSIPSFPTSTSMLTRSPTDVNENNATLSSPGAPSREECKASPPTQSEFSIVTSWSFVLQLLPGLVMAVPMGLLADRHGRTLVMALSMAGMTLNFGFSVFVCSYPDLFGGSLRWTWAGSLFNFLGGGMTVFSAMVFSMLSDVSGEGERSTAFSYLTAGMHAGAIIAPPTTYSLMKVLGDWTTIYVGLSILLVSVIFAICLPETLKANKNPQDDPTPMEEDTGKTILTRKNLFPKIKTSLLRFRDFLKLLQTNLLLLLASILLTTFGRDAQTVLMQYVTVKFGWSWGQAGLIQSVQSITTLTLLTVLLPLASYLLFSQPQNKQQQQGRSHVWRRVFQITNPQQRDLILARISIALQTIGAFSTGIAPSAGVLIPSVVVSSLGQGFNLLVRGLMTTSLLLSSSSSSNGFDILPGSRTSHTQTTRDNDDTTTNAGDEEVILLETETGETPRASAKGEKGEKVVEKEKETQKARDKDNHIALLNSTIAWVETAGAMIATPLLAGSFRLGLSWGGGIWTGLPFFLAAGLFSGATVIVLFARGVRDQHDTMDLGHEGDADADLDLEDGRRHGRYTLVNQHA